MRRTQEWLLFSIQLVIKMGFLGRYKLVPVTVEEKDNRKGLKILEKTILSLGKKNDELGKKNNELGNKNYELGKRNKVLIKKNEKLFGNATKQVEQILRMKQELVDFSTTYASFRKEAESEKNIFEKDILGLQQKLEYELSKNTEIDTRLSDSVLENASLKNEIKDWLVRDSKWAESLQNEKVSFQEKFTSLNTELATYKREKLECVKLEKEILSLNSTLEQATILSEKLQGEMKKWRT